MKLFLTVGSFIHDFTSVIKGIGKIENEMFLQIVEELIDEE